jgi:hypothetical protein
MLGDSSNLARCVIMAAEFKAGLANSDEKLVVPQFEIRFSCDKAA